MVFKCVVKNCGNSHLTEKMHVFPKDPERFKMWAQACGRNDICVTKFRSYRVCDVHFSNDEKYEVFHNKTNLKRNAVPNLHLPDIDGSTTTFLDSAKTPLCSTMTCCIPSCTNIQRLLPPNSNITFHRLPQGEFFDTFKNVIGRPDLQWSKRRSICSQHFSDIDFIKGKKLFLKKSALPSRNLGTSQISQASVNIQLTQECTAPSRSVSFGESIPEKSKQELRDVVRAESPISITSSESSISSDTLRERSSFVQTLHSYSRNSKTNREKQLKKWYDSIEYEPGFSLMCFHILKKINEITDTKLLCTLICHEMTITKKIEYDGKRIWGYSAPVAEDDDEVEVATEVFVLIVVCHTELWKIPIGYFLNKSFSAQSKSDIVKQALIRLNKVKIDITSVTCSGTAANFAMFQELGCEWSDLQNITSHFLHPSTRKNVYAIFDVCYLQKLVENNFVHLKTFIDENGQQIEWKFIERLHVIHKRSFGTGDELELPQLSQKLQKTQDKLGTKIIEEDIADSLELLQKDQNNKYFQNCEGTIRFIRTINQLIDLLNSRNQFEKNYKIFKINNEETWNTFLMETNKYLLSLTDRNGILLCQSKMKLPFLGFALTIQSTIDMFNDFVLNDRLNRFLTYKMSMNHLEKFLSNIRSHCGGKNPTCLQFYHCYKKLLLDAKMPGQCDSNWVLDE